jgi:hypothetical protein
MAEQRYTIVLGKVDTVATLDRTLEKVTYPIDDMMLVETKPEAHIYCYASTPQKLDDARKYAKTRGFNLFIFPKQTADAADQVVETLKRKAGVA